MCQFFLLWCSSSARLSQSNHDRYQRAGISGLWGHLEVLGHLHVAVIPALSQEFHNQSLNVELAGEFFPKVALLLLTHGGCRVPACRVGPLLMALLLHSVLLLLSTAAVRSSLSSLHSFAASCPYLLRNEVCLLTLGQSV